MKHELPPWITAHPDLSAEGSGWALTGDIVVAAISSYNLLWCASTGTLCWIVMLDTQRRQVFCFPGKEGKSSVDLSVLRI
jgi:hypothetical protein